jgi:uncharacterized protein (DUF697 family)
MFMAFAVTVAVSISTGVLPLPFWTLLFVTTVVMTIVTAMTMAFAMTTRVLQIAEGTDDNL